jgi:predicted secreted protein
VSVAGSGVFTGSAAEIRLKGNALTGQIDDYELSFESGERMRGRFLLTRLDYAGDFNGERSYALALESSGTVTSS